MTSVSEGRATAHPWAIVAFLSAAMAFSLIDRFALSLLFTPIKADLGLSDTQLGLLHGVAFGIFYAFLGIPIASLVDRWSRKWVIFIGIAVWSVSTGLCGLADSFSALLLARIGVAAGEAALAPAGYSIITDIVPRNRLGTAMSTFQAGSLIGAGLAFLLGGPLYAAIAAYTSGSAGFVTSLSPWQWTFVVLALPGLPFLLAMLFMREPRRQTHQAANNSLSAAEPSQTILRALRDRFGVLGPLFIGNACLVGVSYALVSWAPTVLARNFGWTIAEVGAAIGTIMLIVAPLGVLGGGMLADFWTRRGVTNSFARVLVLAALTTLPLTLLIALVDSGVAIITLIAALQFATAAAVGTGPAAVQIHSPTELRGRVSAVYVFAVNLIGLGIGPVAIGLLSDHVFVAAGGLQYSLAAFCVTMSLIAALLLIRFRAVSAS